ncbi:MAG: hypothetical protein ACMUJM_15295 [bacterium]
MYDKYHHLVAHNLLFSLIVSFIAMSVCKKCRFRAFDERFVNFCFKKKNLSCGICGKKCNEWCEICGNAVCAKHGLIKKGGRIVCTACKG